MFTKVHFAGQLTYNKISSSSKICNSKKKFDGSSSFIVDINHNIIYQKTDLKIYDELAYIIEDAKQSINAREKYNKMMKDYHDLDVTNKELTKKYFLKKERKSTISLNKNKIISRAVAFSQTTQAKKFMAFYSISFPQNMTEDDIYKAFNKWLTNCRRYYNLKNYLWVAEYQKNGTLHFHLLTCDYMKIQDVNKSMSVTLDNQKAFTNEETEYYNRKQKKVIKGKLTKENYNGCDVVRVNGDKSKVIMYMVKYMTKDNNHEYKRQPWHCSKSVSALFTVERLDIKEYSKIINEINNNVDVYLVENEYCKSYIFNKKIEVVDENTGEIKSQYYQLPNKYFSNIKHINQLIFNELQN